MRKNRKNSENCRQNGVSAESALPQISLRYLADIYGFDPKSLHLAIAETDDGEGGVDISPVVVIDHSDIYIDLVSGHKKKTAHAFGRKQNFSPAISTYDGGNFVFAAPRIETSVNASVLKKHYGTAIIDD